MSLEEADAQTSERQMKPFHSISGGDVRSEADRMPDEVKRPDLLDVLQKCLKEPTDFYTICFTSSVYLNGFY